MVTLDDDGKAVIETGSCLEPLAYTKKNLISFFTTVDWVAYRDSWGDDSMFDAQNAIMDCVELLNIDPALIAQLEMGLPNNAK